MTLLDRQNLQYLRLISRNVAIDDDFVLRRFCDEDATPIFEIINSDLSIKPVMAMGRLKSSKEIIPYTRQYTYADELNEKELYGPFVILRNSELVGYVGLWYNHNLSAFYFNYFVASRARGHGCAARSVRALIAELQKLITAEVQLYIQMRQDNKASAALAESLEFTLAEELMGIDIPVMQVRYRKTLKPITLGD